MATKGGSFYPYYDEKGDLKYKSGVSTNFRAVLTPELDKAIEYATQYGIDAAISEYGSAVGMRLVANDGADFGSMSVGDILKKCN